MPAVSIPLEASQTVRPDLTTKLILRLYVPLALSWVFMALESPSITAIIGRMPDKVLNSAALLVMMSMSLWIESPVIDLLSTATTLAKDQQRNIELRRYVILLIAWVTFAHALFVLTPIYYFVTLRMLSLPREVAEHARVGLYLMIPWSGFIGWRRYLQGILIRFHRTRLISVGTFVRICTISTVGWSLFFFSHLPPMVIAASALVSSVGAESIFIHFASKGTLLREFGEAVPADSVTDDDGFAPSEIVDSAILDTSIPDVAPANGPITMRKLMAFHLPLTATTMVALVGTPMISAALAQSSDPKLSLASWQVVVTLVWLCRTIEFALPEVIITLYKDAQSAAKLRFFSISVGLIIAGAMALAAFSGADRLFFSKVLGEDPPTVAMAHLAFLCAITLPLIGSQQNYIKGMLTAHHLTTARFMSSLVSFLTLMSMLILCVRLGLPGVVNAGISLNVALLCEVLVLFTFWRRGVKRLGIRL